MRAYWATLLAVIVIFLATAQKAYSEDQNFFGVDLTNDNYVSIDINTGKATIIGGIGFNAAQSGMETLRTPTATNIGILPAGTQFGVFKVVGPGPDSGKDFVFIIEQSTGLATKVVEIQGGVTGRGMAFGEDGKTVFVTDQNLGDLFTVDLVTGAKTNVGNFGIGGIDNLRWDPISKKFVAIGGMPPQKIVYIDPNTAQVTFGPVLSKDLPTVCSLSKSPFTGEWFTSDENEFVKIDINTGQVTTIGSLGPDAVSPICGTSFNEIIAGAEGGDDHEPPTIGKSLDGERQVVINGISIDGQTWTVTKGYHQDFELLQMLTGPHVISNEIYCNEAVQECNYIAVAFMKLDEYFPTATMKVEAQKNLQGDWEISWSDPHDFIKDPDDEIDPKAITFTRQIIDEHLLGTSFTIFFKNKDTGQLKLGIQVRDEEGGIRNFYFNEGVQLNDADSYPDVETSYEKPLEVKQPCIDKNPKGRNTCAFGMVKKWTSGIAQNTLNEILNGDYIYDYYYREHFSEK